MGSVNSMFEMLFYKVVNLMFNKVRLFFWNHMKGDITHSIGFCILFLLVGLDMGFRGIAGLLQSQMRTPVFFMAVSLVILSFILLRISIILGKNSLSLLQNRGRQ